jgi:hypothetical protein
MKYLILDSTGSAVNEYADEVAAHVGLRNLVAEEPEAADHLALLAYGDDGQPVGGAVTFDDLPPSTTRVNQTAWVLVAHSCAFSLDVALDFPRYVPTPRRVVLDPPASASSPLAAA